MTEAETVCAEASDLEPGRLELEIDCNGGVASYASNEAGFGEGSLQIVRLTVLDALGCE